jgi:hypothetical protein
MPRYLCSVVNIRHNSVGLNDGLRRNGCCDVIFAYGVRSFSKFDKHSGLGWPWVIEGPWKVSKAFVILIYIVINPFRGHFSVVNSEEISRSKRHQ